MEEQNEDYKGPDRRHYDNPHLIIIDHIHPLQERVIGLEKTAEFQVERTNKLESFIEQLFKMRAEDRAVLLQIKWILLGCVGAGGALFAFIKLLLPLLGVPTGD